MPGSVPLSRTMIEPKALHKMVSAVDGFETQVVAGRYRALMQSPRVGGRDCLIGASRNPAPAENVASEFLFQDASALVAPLKHLLAQKRAIAPDETLIFPWIAPQVRHRADIIWHKRFNVPNRPDTDKDPSTIH